MPSKKRAVIGILVGLWLYALLPATATMFYELYHLTHVDAVYHGYSAFKAAGYYFGIWPYQALACIAVTALIMFFPLGRGGRSST